MDQAGLNKRAREALMGLSKNQVVADVAEFAQPDTQLLVDESEKVIQAMRDRKQLLFELRGRDGRVWKLYANGETTGFPDGTIIMNDSAGVLDLLCGWIKRLQRAVMAGQQR